jgi:hypothetical protein
MQAVVAVPPDPQPLRRPRHRPREPAPERGRLRHSHGRADQPRQDRSPGDA